MAQYFVLGAERECLLAGHREAEEKGRAEAREKRGCIMSLSYHTKGGLCNICVSRPPTRVCMRVCGCRTWQRGLGVLQRAAHR